MKNFFLSCLLAVGVTSTFLHAFTEEDSDFSMENSGWEESPGLTSCRKRACQVYTIRDQNIKNRVNQTSTIISSYSSPCNPGWYDERGMPN